MIDGNERWRRPGRWVAGLVFVFVVGSVIAYRVASTSGVKQEVEAIRKRGLPTSPRELDDWYRRVPQKENAAMAYVDAYLSYITPKKNPSEMGGGKTLLGQALPEEMAEAVAEHVGRNAETLAKIHAASNFKASRYPVDLSRGFETLLPHLSQVKQMVQLVKWEAIQFSEGAGDKAVKSLKSGFALAASLEEEPLYISQLVRIACVGILLPALERVVTENQLSDAELLQLGELLTRAEQIAKSAMSRGLAGERAAGIPLFDLNYKQFVQFTGGGIPPMADELPEMLKAAVFNLRRATGIQHRDLVFYLERMGEMERAFEKDYPEMRTEAQKSIDTVENEIPKQWVRYLVSGMMLPALSKAAHKEVVLSAQLRCARMALAIERYRLQNGGKLPNPGELAPRFLATLPTDPFDNQPLLYEKQPKGYRIVCAGIEAEKLKGSVSTNFTSAFTVLR